MPQPSKGTLSLKEFVGLKIQLQKNERIAFTVVSGSMEPLIMTGEPITVRRLNDHQLRRYDIVVFFDSHRLVCHYIWHKNFLKSVEGLQTFVTRGMPGYDDLPVSEDRILGLVASHKLSKALIVRLHLKYWVRKKVHPLSVFFSLKKRVDK
jgi:signal peptidase I